MTRIYTKNGIRMIEIATELRQQCDFCGKIAELRPYGPKGESICYECGMKDEETTSRRAGIVLFGDKDGD